MCVLLLIRRPAHGVAFVVAANRDEYVYRPSLPPAEIAPGVFAGKDVQAGGTWLGLNRAGLMVGVTNRSFPPADPDSPSRGLLCRDALLLETPGEVEEFVRRRASSHPYAGFNLVAVDRRVGTCLHFDGRLRAADVGEGLHVVSSHRDMDESGMSERAVAAGVLEDRHEGPGLPSGLRQVLRNHADEGGFAICKHAGLFGTVSSTLLVVPEGDLREVRYEYAEGPPCTSPFLDYSAAAAKVLGVKTVVNRQNAKAPNEPPDPPLGRKQPGRGPRNSGRAAPTHSYADTDLATRSGSLRTL